jgi:excisionase family DNA binding protein
MPDTVRTVGPWNPAQFAQLYQVSRATVYNWINAGLLPSVKIAGGVRRILDEHHTEFKRNIGA